MKRKLLFILNKLTPEKFSILKDQILDLNMDTLDKLEAAADLIFEKAIREPLFCAVYANMCDVLTDRVSHYFTTFPADIFNHSI